MGGSPLREELGAATYERDSVEKAGTGRYMRRGAAEHPICAWIGGAASRAVDVISDNGDCTESTVRRLYSCCTPCKKNMGKWHHVIES